MLDSLRRAEQGKFGWRGGTEIAVLPDLPFHLRPFFPLALWLQRAAGWKGECWKTLTADALTAQGSVGVVVGGHHGSEGGGEIVLGGKEGGEKSSKSAFRQRMKRSWRLGGSRRPRGLRDGLW